MKARRDGGREVAWRDRKEARTAGESPGLALRGQEGYAGGQLREGGTEVEGSSVRHGVHVPAMRGRVTQAWERERQ